MQEMEKIINLYHIGFLICLALSMIFLLVTVFLFFKFDIRNIIDLKTGRGAKKTIQKMEELNAKTGKLRQEMAAQTPSVLRPEERIVFPPTEKTAKDNSQETEEMMDTEVLPAACERKEKNTPADLPGAFEIIKDSMWIHTDEVI